MMSGGQNSTDDDWYISGSTSDLMGPLNSTSIRELYREGIIDGLTFTWRTGMSEWKHIADIDDLKSLLISAEDDDRDIDSGMNVVEVKELGTIKHLEC